MNYIYSPDSVSPPGDTLLELLNDRNISLRKIEKLMMIPKETIIGLLYGKVPITNDVAIRLEKALGISSDFWLQREANYRASLEHL